MSWTAFMAAIHPARLGPGKVFHGSAVAAGPSPGAARPGLVNRAADFSDGNHKSDQSGNQQPGTTLDGHQDAGANDRTHANPNRKCINQFHQTHVTAPGPGFNSRFPVRARGGRIPTLPPTWASAGGAPVSDPAVPAQDRAMLPDRRPALRWWWCQEARARRIAEVPAGRPAPARKNSRPRAAFPNIVSDMARVGPALT